MITGPASAAMSSGNDALLIMIRLDRIAILGYTILIAFFCIKFFVIFNPIVEKLLYYHQLWLIMINDISILHDD